MNEFDKTKRYLITGGAGFIGFHLTKRLLTEGADVIGFDNLNDYYDVQLKEDRLQILQQMSAVDGNGSYRFVKGDLADKETVMQLFAEYKPQIVVNLAAQAGVRYSIDHPDSYIQSNIIGFYDILEACRHYPVEHLLFASSSSVYGGNTKIPFSTQDKVDEPVSLYAATKKSDELMAHCYSKLYGIPATGLRFFTVYGPYGRPDMAYFSFTKRILAGEPIDVFHNGDLYRDFTYVDDVIECLLRILPAPPAPDDDGDRYRLMNIGNAHPEKLTRFLEVLQDVIGKEAVIRYLPMQPGDVYMTCADTTRIEQEFDFAPHTPLETGLKHFYDWYRGYYGVNA